MHGRWIVITVAISVALLISFSLSSAAGSPDCQSPLQMVANLPYVDTGDTTLATTNTISFYPPSGSLDPYEANELIYEMSLGPTNVVTITIEGIPNQTDHAVFVLRQCGNGMSLESFSQDTVDDLQPERITGRHYPTGIYYITIDGWSGAPGYPATGAYTLTVSGNLGFDGTPAPTNTPTRTPIATTTPVMITPTATPSPTPTAGATSTPTVTANPSPTMIPTLSPTPTLTPVLNRPFKAWLPIVLKSFTPVQQR